MSANKFHLALSAYAAATNAAALTLRQAAREEGFTTWEQAQPEVLTWAGRYYGVPIVVSKSSFNKGQKALNRSAPRYEAAKTAVRRVRECLLGGDADAPANSQKADRVQYEIPADIAAAAAKLAALCREYDEAKRLAAQAIAAAFAAK